MLDFQCEACEYRLLDRRLLVASLVKTPSGVFSWYALFMNVIISPNIKRESERINPNGEVIDPRTKQVIKHSAPDYVPTAEDFRRLEEKSARSENLSSPSVDKSPEPSQSESSPIAQAVKKQVQAAVAEAMKEIDISKMVAEAVKEAFK